MTYPSVFIPPMITIVSKDLSGPPAPGRPRSGAGGERTQRAIKGEEGSAGVGAARLLRAPGGALSPSADGRGEEEKEEEGGGKKLSAVASAPHSAPGSSDRIFCNE